LKACTNCKIEKPYSEFYKHRVTSYQSWCKKCMVANNKSHKNKNREQARQLNKRNKRHSRYGLTDEQYKALETSHNGCRICGGLNESGRALHIDHDHETGIVRGLLCHNCNTGLGKFKEDTELMLKAIEYLMEFGGNQTWQKIQQ